MKKIFLLILSLFLFPICSALTSAEGVIIFGTIFSLATIVIFFLILSIITKNAAMKIFFVGLAFLTLVSSVGIGVSTLQEFFPDLSTITTMYGSFYILLTVLTGAGVIALIIWLIIVAFKSFYSYRGMND
jgi:hypothetical protein